MKLTQRTRDRLTARRQQRDLPAMGYVEIKVDLIAGAAERIIDAQVSVDGTSLFVKTKAA